MRHINHHIASSHWDTDTRAKHWCADCSALHRKDAQKQIFCLHNSTYGQERSVKAWSRDHFIAWRHAIRELNVIARSRDRSRYSALTAAEHSCRCRWMGRAHVTLSRDPLVNRCSVMSASAVDATFDIDIGDPRSGPLPSSFDRTKMTAASDSAQGRWGWADGLVTYYCIYHLLTCVRYANKRHADINVTAPCKLVAGLN